VGISIGAAGISDYARGGRDHQIGTTTNEATGMGETIPPGNSNPVGRGRRGERLGGEDVDENRNAANITGSPKLACRIVDDVEKHQCRPIDLPISTIRCRMPEWAIVRALTREGQDGDTQQSAFSQKVWGNRWALRSGTDDNQRHGFPGGMQDASQPQGKTRGVSIKVAETIRRN
jgi:hypothetical protein